MISSCEIMKIIAVGNPLKGDDSIALHIAKNLNYKVIFAEQNPENFISQGNNVIIIDAVDFGGKPGDVKLFKKEEFDDFVLNSTHSIQLPMLNTLCNKIYLIGIQPKSINYGDTLSNELQNKKGKITKDVDRILKEML